MVDMTGRKAIDAPLPPPGPIKPKCGRETTDQDRMFGAASLAIIFAGLAGLGFQLEQWWLMFGAGVASLLFIQLAQIFSERKPVTVDPNPLSGDRS